jgi:hypothetical protein
MRRVKFAIFSIAAMATFASLIPAAASGALPEFLPTGTKATFTMTSGATTIGPIGGGAVECSADTGSGSITGAKTFSIRISCTGTKAFGFSNCTTSGSKSGEIVVNGTGTLGFVKSTSPLEVGASVAIVETEFACAAGLLKAKLRGAAIGFVSPINTSSTTGLLRFTGSAGKQNPLHFEGGSDLTLEISKNGSTFEQADLISEETLTYSEKITVDG